MLTDAERRTLQGWASRRKTAQGLAQRARIVLMCADGKTNIAVAAELRITRETVGKWRNRFIRQRFAGLSDEPRPGVPRTIADAQIEEVVVRTLEEAPEGATHWSKRELARQVGLSPTTIHRIWRAFGLKPWLVEEFKLSTDPFLINKVRDVVGLYLAPPANAAVFSVDEKPQIQALERTAPVLPMVPGTPERRSHDYERHGTVDLFAALNTATGMVIGKTSAQHAAQDFTAFLDEIDRRVEPDLAVHLICDNLSVHKAPAVKRWLLEHPRFQLHFTPTYSSWLNQVERWFAELQRRRLDRGVFCSIDELTCALEQWIKFWNENARPFKWTKTADQIIDAIGRYCERISGPGHYHIGIQCLKAMTAAQVIAVDTSEDALKLALDCGADHSVTAAGQQAQQVRDLTGLGDVTFSTSLGKTPRSATRLRCCARAAATTWSATAAPSPCPPFR